MLDSHQVENIHKQALIIGVGAVIYRYNQRGRLCVLLIKKRGGYWTLPKGKLLPDEPQYDALTREISEETGLLGEVGDLAHTVSYTITKRGKSVQKQVTYYLVRPTGGELSPGRSENIIKANWFTVTQALRRIERRRIRRVLMRAVPLIPELVQEDQPSEDLGSEAQL